MAAAVAVAVAVAAAVAVGIAVAGAFRKTTIVDGHGFVVAAATSIPSA